MIRHLKPALQVTTTLLSLISPLLFAAATDDEAPSWYEVELIIYANRTPTSEEQPEIWSRQLSLNYPERWIALTEEPFTKEQLTETPEETSESITELSRLAEEKEDATNPEAYKVLPKESLQLQTTKERMERSRRYQVLFHKSWRQIISKKSEMPSILIEGGEEFSGLRELSGYITLHKSRYLHIESNLWLSHFSANTGEQAGEEWPYLPLAPNKIDLDKLELLQIDQEIHQTDTQQHTAYENTAYKSIETINSDTSSFDDNSTDLTPINTNDWSLLGYQDLVESTFIADRIVVLQQRRKMRSSELHNLDHPLFGLLIKLTPYELPEAKEKTGSIDTKTEN